MIRYYSDDDHPNIVIRFTEPATFEVLRPGDLDWFELPPDSSYMREIFIGQGNNCMTEITISEAKRIAERMIINDIHTGNKKGIEALF